MTYARAQLDRLADFLAGDVLAMSDEEVLAEMAEDGVDPAEFERQARAEINAAIAKHRASA